VAAYADTKQLSRVSDVHTSIIDTYREDYPKYIGSRNLARFHQVFNYAAQTVGQKVKYSQFSNTEQSKTIKADIDLLCMARILSKVTHSHCNGLPLQAELSTKVFKLLFLDIGLMNALCGLNWHQITLQDDLRLINEGKIAEQFIGQHLLDYLSTGPNRELTYWLREGKANNAEVDFVIALNGQIVPIEIKSGSSGTLKSLHQFMGEKKLPLAVRFDNNPSSRQIVKNEIWSARGREKANYELLSLPLYLVERVADLTNEI